MGHLSQAPRVIVFLSTASKANRDKLHGIFRYLRLHTPWNVQIIDRLDAEQLRANIRRWQAQGIIINHMPEVSGLLAGIRVPTVIMDDRRRYGRGFLRRASFITCDSRAIAEQAAEVLLAEGFTSFAFVGDVRAGTWSMERGRIFQAHLRRRGFSCPLLERPVAADWVQEQARMTAWLRALPPRTAVFVSHDLEARHILELCQIAGIEVPAHCAVLGCDNDEMVCEHTAPRLSSVDPDFAACGYHAAELLERLMREPRRRPQVILYGAARVVVRDSSRLVARSLDERVRRGLDFIRLNASSPIRVADVARHMQVSRRSAELLFRTGLDHSIQAEIQAVRLEKLKRFLIETDLSIAAISGLCGYPQAAHAMRVFRRVVGMTMGRYRAQHAADPAGLTRVRP